MRMQTRIGFGILAAWLVSGIGAASSAGQSDKDRQAPTVIRAEDLGQTVQVVGRLGYPLHEVVTLSGAWFESNEPQPKPDTRLRFRVDQVNGKRLDKAVDFHPNDVTISEKLGVEAAPANGERWELRAYETWPIRYHPDEYLKELGVAPSASPAHDATRMFGVLKRRTAR